MKDLHLHINHLRDLRVHSVRQFGAKASNLGELLNAGVEVPRGVALAKDVLVYFLRENAIDLGALERLHSLGMTYLESAVAEANEAQAKIVATIENAPFPRAIESMLTDVMGPLLEQSVAVRSSCIVEDSSATSFAGQYLTVLGCGGLSEVLAAVRACWKSQYSGRVLGYALARRGMPVLTPSMGILIQQLLTPAFAGVCFTSGPTPKTRDLAVVECVPGLGEALVSGERTPWHYELDASGSIRNVRKPLDEEQTSAPPESMIRDVLHKARQVERHFGHPQDIEWAATADQVFVLQARPITTGGVGRRAQTSTTTYGIAATTADQGRRGDASLLLRDDLHEWLLSQVDPAMFRCACFLLSSQREDGAWRVDGHPEWDEVTTSMTLRLLLDGGLPPAAHWSAPRDTDSSTRGLPEAVKWIVKRTKEDGTWGSDLWDTCQVVRALVRWGIAPTDPAVARAIDVITNEMLAGLDSHNEQEWFGAGFLAAALNLALEIHNHEIAQRCATLLLASQTSGGEFCGPNAELNGSKVPSEWHTAQAVSALTRWKNPDANEAIRRSIDWLLSRQKLNGSWGVDDEPYCRFNTFFSAYALMALMDAGVDNIDAVQKAMKWLRSQQLTSGAFGDAGATLLTLAALQRKTGPAFSLNFPLTLFLRIQQTLGRTPID